MKHKVKLIQVDKRNAKDNETTTNSDHVVDSFSNAPGDMKQINSYPSDILHQDDNTPHPRQLPNEITSLIINHLTQQQGALYQCALVSMQFYMISNPLLWQAPSLFYGNDSDRFVDCISNASPERQATIGQHIHELRLRGAHWTDDQLKRLLPHIPHLKHLSIHKSTPITDTSFQHLPYNCQQLTSLELDSTRLAHVSFFVIGKHCPRLRDLEWNLSLGQSPEWLEMLTCCPLERLAITSLDTPLNEYLMTVIKLFDHLTCLDIHHSASAPTNILLLPTTTTTTTADNHPPLDNHHGIHTTVTTPWPQLTHLTLFPCDDIDTPMLDGFISSHPHLQYLDLMNIRHLTDTGLDTVAMCLPNLTETTLTGTQHISPDGIRRFIRQCGPGLKKIKLSWCSHVFSVHFPELGLDPNNCSSNLELDQTTMDKIRESTNEIKIGNIINNHRH